MIEPTTKEDRASPIWQGDDNGKKVVKDDYHKMELDEYGNPIEWDDEE